MKKNFSLSEGLYVYAIWEFVVKDVVNFSVAHCVSPCEEIGRKLNQMRHVAENIMVKKMRG